MQYFGTDGIRGVAGEDLTARVAFSLGNALCRLRRAPRVVLGRDPRASSDMLALAFSAGVAAGGGTVYDGGVLPTAAVSFFVRRDRADFGVMISASHNPPEYNGLKVFGPDGRKLAEEDEARAEHRFGEYLHAPSPAAARTPIFSVPARRPWPVKNSSSTAPAARRVPSRPACSAASAPRSSPSVPGRTGPASTKSAAPCTPPPCARR